MMVSCMQGPVACLNPAFGLSESGLNPAFGLSVAGL